MSQRKQAFLAGVSRLCKEASLDQEDRHYLNQLLLSDASTGLPIAMEAGRASRLEHAKRAGLLLAEHSDLIKEAFSLGDAAGGAATGAMYGSMAGLIPIPGAGLVGAGVGGLIGGLWGGFGGGSKPQAPAAAAPGSPGAKGPAGAPGQNSSTAMSMKNMQQDEFAKMPGYMQEAMGGSMKSHNDYLSYARELNAKKKVGKSQLRSLGIYGNTMISPGARRGHMAQNMDTQNMDPRLQGMANNLQQAGKMQQDLYTQFQGPRAGMGVRGAGFRSMPHNIQATQQPTGQQAQPGSTQASRSPGTSSPPLSQPPQLTQQQQNEQGRQQQMWDDNSPQAVQQNNDAKLQRGTQSSPGAQGAQGQPGTQPPVTTANQKYLAGLPPHVQAGHRRIAAEGGITGLVGNSPKPGAPGSLTDMATSASTANMMQKADTPAMAQAGMDDSLGRPRPDQTGTGPGQATRIT